MFVDRSVPRISREYERFAFAREMKGALRGRDSGVHAMEQLLPATVERRMLVLRAHHDGLVGVAMMRLSDRLGAQRKRRRFSPTTCSTSRSRACSPE